MTGEIVKLIPNNALCVDAEAIASRLRLVADRIEAGEFGEVERVVVLMDVPLSREGVIRRTYGRPTSNCELVGILEYAKNGVMNPTPED